MADARVASDETEEKPFSYWTSRNSDFIFVSNAFLVITIFFGKLNLIGNILHPVKGEQS